MKNQRKCVSFLEQCETDLLCPKVSTVQFVVMFAISSVRISNETASILLQQCHVFDASCMTTDISWKVIRKFDKRPLNGRLFSTATAEIDLRPTLMVDLLELTPREYEREPRM